MKLSAFPPLTRLGPAIPRSAGRRPAVSQPGRLPAPALRTSAGCQPAIRQRATLRYGAGPFAALGGALAIAGIAFATHAAEPDFSRVPGVVIDHLPAADGRYVGSPGLSVLPNGDYVASHDYFGPKSGEYERALTAVFRSRDRGATWEQISTVNGEFWSTLFVHDDALFLLGTESHYGHAIVRRSDDGGHTWTEPVDGTTGRLFEDTRYHCAPMPMLVHRKRLWRAMEDSQGPGGWGSHFHSFMMSVPLEADLLRATNWVFSNRLLGQTNWLDGRFRGWLEGNAVVDPDGRVVNVLRVDTAQWPEHAAIVEISADGREATFDPETGFVPFPGGAKKFTIRHDPETGLYWSIASYIPPRHRDRRPGSTRNTLALVSSPDLRHWDVSSVLLYRADPVNHGFQYVEWLFDGDDLIAACRTAHDDGLGGAHNNHDANFLTFHRIANFRQLTLDQSPAAIREEVLADEAARSSAPRVLLLGDSISIGYHRFVRQALGNEMVVVRPILAAGQAENCAGTTKGVAEIDRWLGMYGGRWDVIHFNWGLHDLKRVVAETGANSNNPDDPPQADLATYERHLRQIVARLKQSGAALVFATTTPVPSEPVRPWREEADVVRYNDVAVRIMREHGIPVNDLHALAAARLSEWQQPANVHFKPAGSAGLAEAVVAYIRSSVKAVSQ